MFHGRVSHRSPTHPQRSMSTTTLSNTRPPHGPLRGGGRARRTAPFAVLGLVVVIFYLAAYRHELTPLELAILAVMAGGTVALVVFTPWDRVPQGAQIAAPLAVMATVILMQVLALPADLDVAVLFVAPVLWTAMYGTGREVVIITTLAVVTTIALQAIGAATGLPLGVTGWTEAAALIGTVVLLAYFTSTTRSEARTDALTGVANRRTWDDILEVEVSRAARYGGEPIVAMIDLDHFKGYNDAHGHAAGDDHLVRCAENWCTCLRRSDILARVGGEEFAVLLLGADHDDAMRILERLASATPNGQTCSIGAARWNGRESARHLAARADRALYDAKEAGRNRVVIAGADQHPREGHPHRALEAA